MAPSVLRSPLPNDALEPEYQPQDRLGLTPEQAGILDLLEGRVRPVAFEAEGSVAPNLQRDVVLALTGGLFLMAGLVAIFFMAALGAVLLVMGALFCVAAYEHAISMDAAATLLTEAEPQSLDPTSDKAPTATLL